MAVSQSKLLNQLFPLTSPLIPPIDPFLGASSAPKELRGSVRSRSMLSVIAPAALAG
jgi:hypothetical protein